MKNIKNNFIRLILLVAAVMLAAGLFACGGKTDGGDGNKDKPEEVKKVFSLDKTELDLIYGDSAVLIPKNYDESADVIEWKSSDASVAFVEDGAIFAGGVGSAVITATAGDKKAECNVFVSFGNIQPTLEIEHFAEEITLNKGDGYTLFGKIKFNGKDYPAENFAVTFEKEGVAEFSEGKIVPLGVGSTRVFVKGEWNGFDTALTSKEFTLNVISGKVSMTVYTVSDGVREARNDAGIYLVSEWAGNTYPSSVGIEVEVTEDGVKKEGKITADPRDKNIIFADGVVTARGRGIGTSFLTATYTDAEGTEYSQTITIEVYCPVATYPEKITWDGEKFDYTDYFGDKANIISVRQGEKEIDCEPKKIIGKFEFNGEDTETIEILTNKGGYIFNDIYGYDKEITAQNAFSTFALGGKKVGGYYILNGDIGTSSSPVDFTAQSDSSESSYFTGKLFGNGHTVYAKVSRYGIFGGAGAGMEIKNTKFVITFDEKAATASGLFGDENRQNKDSGRGALIENVYIVTTNFGDDRFAVACHRMLGLKLKDVLVDLGDTSAVKDFDGRKNVAALFKIDYNLSPMFNGAPTENKLENVRVITGKFMPVANGDAWADSKSSYLNFAGNDEDKFGKLTRAGTEEPDNARIIGAEFYNEWRREIMLVLNEFTECFTMFYGTYRYDTAADLIADGVTSVGSWKVV